MDKSITDKPMDQDKGKTIQPGKVPVAYVLTAYAIWALIFYSLSPLSQTAPARLAARAVHLCEQTIR